MTSHHLAPNAKISNASSEIGAISIPGATAIRLTHKTSALQAAFDAFVSSAPADIDDFAMKAAYVRDVLQAVHEGKEELSRQDAKHLSDIMHSIVEGLINVGG